MHRFFESFILPVFQAINPAAIVEVGSEYGYTTERILRYCAENDARLIAIDPAPLFDESAFKLAYGEKFSPRTDLSLNVLPELLDYDIILIDGDHNWYTVYHELLCVEACALKRGRWPVVLFHDVDWPYARRDLYYVPETIPAEYRHPYSTKGLKPGQSEPVDDGGVNYGISNAAHEGGPKNGVLTAIEDFIEHSETNFRFIVVDGFSGLGILASHETLEAKSDLARLLNEFELQGGMLSHVAKLQESINQSLFEDANKTLALARKDAEIDTLRQQLQATLDSRRWKIGNAIGNAFDALTLKRMRKKERE